MQGTTYRVCMDKLPLARLPLALMCPQSLTSVKGPQLRNVQGEEEGRELL